MKNIKPFPLLLGVSLIALLCFVLKVGLFDSSPPTHSQDQKIKVVASFYPIYFFAAQIGGDRVEVENITPSGAEPHDYEPTARDLAGIENSALLILNGGNLEAWGNKIKDNLSGGKVVVITAGDDLITQDAHVWLDPILAKKEAQNIAQGLVKIDPRGSSYFENNLKTLEIKFDKLDNDYRNGLINCEEGNIITSHAAFGSLAARYQLEQISIAGLSPDEEPSPQKMAEIVKFAKDNNIKYIFFESLVSPKLSETIATEVGAKTLVLDPIEGISEEGMQKGKDYFSIMEDNLKNLKEALQCTK